MFQFSKDCEFCIRISALPYRNIYALGLDFLGYIFLASWSSAWAN